MRVDSTIPYHSRLDAIGTRPHSAAAAGSKEPVAGAAPAEPSAAASPAKAPVTGLLSAMTAAQAIRSGQEVGEESEGEESEGEVGLPIAMRHYVEDIANDPAYGMSEAERWAKHPIAVLTKLPVPADGQEGPVDPAVFQAALDRWQHCASVVQSVQDKAAALYDKGKAEGKSGAEIYADILELQLSQPAGYWQARDPDHLSGDLRGTARAELAALRRAMAAGAGAA